MDATEQAEKDLGIINALRTGRQVESFFSTAEEAREAQRRIGRKCEALGFPYLALAFVPASPEGRITRGSEITTQLCAPGGTAYLKGMVGYSLGQDAGRRLVQPVSEMFAALYRETGKRCKITVEWEEE